MSIATKKGAWLSTRRVVRFHCTEHGDWLTSKYPMNDREEYEVIKEHAKLHGGIDRGM